VGTVKQPFDERAIVRELGASERARIPLDRCRDRRGPRRAGAGRRQCTSVSTDTREINPARCSWL